MNQPDDTRRIVMAGLLSGTAFLAEQLLDQAIWPQGYSDMELLGMAVTRKSPQYWFIGVPWHLINSVAFAWVYARIAGPLLAGPGPVRGLLMGLIENNGLWFTLLPLA